MVMEKKKLIILIGAGLLLLALILSLLIPVLEINGVYSKDKETTITVLNGESFGDIVKKLKDNEVIHSELTFKVYAKLFYKKEINNIKAGIFKFNGKLKYGEVINIIASEPGYEEITVTIPEGYELREIAQLFADKGLCDKDKFIEVANTYDFDFKYKDALKNHENRLEGFLFPDTYRFTYSNTDEVKIIQTMLDRFTEVYSKYENVPSKYSVYEIITLASIIEREAKTNEDFYNVSSVFYNRLKRSDYLNKLQSCATVQYILKERKSILSLSDIEIDSPYNTYKYPGLPVGPIASVGERAIDAALNPNNTSYLYFLNDENGTLHFSATLDEHSRKMKKYL